MNPISETVKYNHASFPAYIQKGVLSKYPDYAAAAHWHEDLEFIVILQGSMSYNVNGQMTELTAGNGIFVNSRQIHYGFSAAHTECIFICVLLHPSLLSANESFYRQYIEPLLWQSPCPFLPLHRQCAADAHILKLITEIYDTRKQALSPFFIQRDFFDLMGTLYEHLLPMNMPVSQTTQQLDVLKEMITYIQTNYKREISLNDIAASGACCKSKCSALFKQYLKDSPITFLNQYRLKKSCDLLRDTNAAITQIAFECGYHSSSYYCESFRNYYHTSPLEYRKKTAAFLHQ